MMAKSKSFIIIVVVCLFTLFYNLKESTLFIGDFGWYYLEARDFLLGKHIPLVGIPSSVPILRQGAVWTWLLAGALRIGNFNPYSGAYLAALLGFISIILTYIFVRDIWGEKLAILLGLFVATSPLLIFHLRLPFQTAPIYLATLLLVRSFSKSMKLGGWYYLILGFFLSILFQLELAAFILFPIVILSYLISKRPEIREILTMFAGGFFGLLPFFIYDMQSGVFIQTLGFLVWILQKAYEEVFSATGGKLLETKSFLYFFKNLIFPWSAVIAIIVLAASFLHFLRDLFHKNKVASETKLIFIWLILGFSGFLFKGHLSDAYMPIMFFPGMLVVSWGLLKIIKIMGKLGWLIALALFFLNIYYLLQTDFLLDKGASLMIEQIKVSDYIIESIDEKDYELLYLGPGYQFHTAGDNFEYILWWKGNPPKRNVETSFLIYTDEFKNKVPGKNVKIGRYNLLKQND